MLVLIQKRHNLLALLWPLLMMVSPYALTNNVSPNLTDLAGNNTVNIDQTKLYKQTLIAIRKGHRSNTQKGLKALTNYPLYPYLVKAQLQRQFSSLPYEQIDQFLADNNNSVAGKQLHQRWLLSLANKKHWDDFMKYYQPQIAGNQLRCHRLEALHQTGYSNIALQETADIWLSSESMPKACDKPFKRWESSALKTDDLVWRRVRMALDRNNTLLARYLSKRASAALKPFTRRLISVHRHPQRLSKQADFQNNHLYNVEIITHGLTRLASRDRIKASELWVSYRGFIDFNQKQHQIIRNKIARQYIAAGDPESLDWLITHDPNADDSYLLEWRIRLAIKQEQWQQAGKWIKLLNDELRNKPRWRYWLARVYLLEQSSQPIGLDMLEQLASERHYYGFLAADFSGLNYDFNHSPLQLSEQTDNEYQPAAMQRARAFYQMGELTAARREWNNFIETLDQKQLISATQLAYNWGWYQQAIQTTIKADEWNDLDIRFPLAFLKNMKESAEKTTIDLEWLYAIARQESAFAEDAYSSAGARGLLQLRPSTAKYVAKKIGIKFNKSDLYSPVKNIKLGSNYLKQLLADFEGNQILATAAYNAGPKRLKRWLSRQGNNLPYDVWIETLPFHETRDYVQNVLAFSVIYGRQLGLSKNLINQSDSIINYRPNNAN